ncbi:hypothetical protein [Vibrio comitans]|uniref:Glycosyl hydrolase 36 catalytic domain-containing protein n=1 Tax=Vibrio comitans NBRC 102076 TaxID=1219078 RepID=A0A4Y3IPM5_9VIBR|nr:hypothetical protein [Vibrio comitans]GEA61316.1 hypothetical protein VCO01S_25090 [Vibrio comitans NBRC 102076]
MEHNTLQDVDGKFVNLDGERYYKISNVYHMNPFFISVVSASDHWLFISSTGSLSAGRIRPENALFPYKSVDYIHESAENTGAKSIFKVKTSSGVSLWEPFNTFHDGLYQVERNLYKNSIGDKIIFEEINHSLKLQFQYSWNTSEQFGFIRQSQLTDLSGDNREIELLDGLQNLLPPGAPLGALQTRSALVDAYKWNERQQGSPLALYTMYAKLSDRADPAESLLATTVFSLDDDASQILLTSSQIAAFRKGLPVQDETLTKGQRGSYLIHKTIQLQGNQTNSWIIAADIDKSHSDITALNAQIAVPNDIRKQVLSSIEDNQKELVSLMSGADAWQLTAEENTSVHHYANVLFNNMRGGVIENNYTLDKADVVKTMRNANQAVVAKHQGFFAELADSFTHAELVSLAKQTDDQQLVRLAYEYLPLTFGRRHGDPSRPWNHYEIKLKDEHGDRLLSYQGNWRDIFQNWEAMALSYPGFIKSFIAKFVNASTVDGFNPYRITKDGIDWELLDPEDEWSNIGYWGDHQIIYLLKFLELADKFEHDELIALLNTEMYSYANVPYEICDVDGLFANPKDTVNFNDEKQSLIERKVAELGSDGKLVLNSDDSVYMVNLLEKILVPLLSKLSNLVLDGGIWLNTQRPEWNDANNAIVGNGLSMVTLYYMRRYVSFMQQMLAEAPQYTQLSTQVRDWMVAIEAILADAEASITAGEVTPKLRYDVLVSLAQAAADYRNTVYPTGSFGSKETVDTAEISKLLNVSLTVLDKSIHNNLREDGLYNAYNIISYAKDSVTVEELYPMLEGQVAVLSSGLLEPQETKQLLDKLYASEMYRQDQKSFMLYPDRDLTPFMEKNQVTKQQIAGSSLLNSMVEKGDKRLVQQSTADHFHFNASFENRDYLNAAISSIKCDYPEATEAQWQEINALYEQVFNHKAFTGRSGTMFGYEGLGCIYWHMVSKLLLAVQENYSIALEQDADSEVTKALADYYYRVREGIGFNKTASNYGAFPTDPYSHTPKQAGAQQPGMTGQVKEEIITRFVELGIQVKEGAIQLNPSLLNSSEFLNEAVTFSYLDIQGEAKEIPLAVGQLAFTYCQVPFVYQVASENETSVEVCFADGSVVTMPNNGLTAEVCQELFSRSGKVTQVRCLVAQSALRS